MILAQLSISSQMVRSEKSLFIGIKSPDSAFLKTYLKKTIANLKNCSRIQVEQVHYIRRLAIIFYQMIVDFFPSTDRCLETSSFHCLIKYN